MFCLATVSLGLQAEGRVHVGAPSLWPRHAAPLCAAPIPGDWLALGGSSGAHCMAGRRTSSTSVHPLVLLVAEGEAAGDASVISASVLPAALCHPLAQSFLCLAGYLVHVAFLSRRHVSLGPFAVGLDTLAGLGVLAAVARHREQTGARVIPSWLFGTVDPADASDAGRECLDLRSAPRAIKLRLAVTAACSLLLPLFFSFAAPLYDLLLFALAAAGLPLTKSSMLGARLLVEQATVYVVLFHFMASRHGSSDGSAGGAPFFGRGSRWVRWDVRRPWLIPVLGGYAVSVALFNLVEPFNQAALPFLDYLPEGLVAKLANPPDGKLSTLALGALTPCVGAPIFEETHSRAFVLQALTSVAPLRLALPCAGLLFGAQHLQAGLVLPLAVCGYFWGVLYAFSGNLLVPVLVHAMWNARVFLGSLLAL